MNVSELGAGGAIVCLRGRELNTNPMFLFRVHVSHECTVSAFVHFPLKTLISYLTSDVKHSLRLTNPPIDRVTEDSIICVTKIFSFFSVEYQRERDSSLTRRKINDLSLDLNSMDSDLTRLKKRWRELTCSFGVFSFQ